MMIEASGLTVQSRIENISLVLERGTITAICGPNGAGKSTLLETLAGLLPPDAGTVSLGGNALAQMSPRDRAKRIGYLPQAHEIAWDVSVRSLVELGRMPHGDTLAEPVDAALESVDAKQFAERRAQTLSGGETARVLLARVLAGQPEWILADEPLAALDIGHQLALIRHLRATADQGVGVVVVLHDLAHAMNHADRAIVLDRGSIAADDPCENALDQQGVERVWGVPARWIGDPGAQALVTG